MPQVAEQLRDLNVKASPRREFIAQNPDRTREIHVYEASGVDWQNQRFTSITVALCNIDIPPGYSSPRARVRLISATERTYHNGEVVYRLSLDGTKRVRNFKHTATFGDVAYGDDGVRQMGSGFSCFPYQVSEKMKDGLRPVKKYPLQIDTKATVLALVTQVKARDFKTPELVVPQIPTQL